eukprot:844809-Prymnesium_polylepis.2
MSTDVHLGDPTTDQTPCTQHLIFLSHHKADAGDAARIFADTARRLLTENTPQTAAASVSSRSGATKKQPLRHSWDDMSFRDQSNMSVRDHSGLGSSVRSGNRSARSPSMTRATMFAG